MLRDWNLMSDDTQLALSHAAMAKASETIARQAEILADEMESGCLADKGGPEALRLLAAVVRVNDPDHVAGHA